MPTKEEQTTTLYSHHIFLFPFKWSPSSKMKQGSKEFDLDKLDTFIDKKYWQPYQFKFVVNPSATYNTYNEYAYFHDYARDILSLDTDGSISKKQYAYKLPQNPIYKIDILGESSFELDIEDISLNFYETGVGVLGFHLNHLKETDFDKALKINEYGRRLYPQFLGSNCNLTDSTKWNFLANSIELLNFDMSIYEHFEYYNTMDNIQNNPFILPAHIQKLLGDAFQSKALPQKEQLGRIVIEPIIDDRMFVMSFFVDSERLEILRGYDMATETYNWQNAPDWHRYIFIDDSTSSCQSRKMLPLILDPCTYDRWLDNTGKWGDEAGKPIGHLFGITRYSFCLLADDCQFTHTILKHHFKSMYFQMTQLVLVQRTSILNFSAEVADIAKNPSADKVSDLYLRYIKFINKIYFREITPQEQGIELYKMLHARMDIEQNVKDLDTEIQELHSYMSLKEEERRNDLLDRITKYGAVLAVAGLVISFFGMNYFNVSDDSQPLVFGRDITVKNAASQSVKYIFGITVLVSMITGIIVFWQKIKSTFSKKQK